MRRITGGPEVSMWVRSGSDMDALLSFHGFTRAGLGRSVGVTGQMISQMISGRRSCSARTAAAIVEAFDRVPLTLDMIFETRARRTPRAAATIRTDGASVRSAA